MANDARIEVSEEQALLAGNAASLLRERWDFAALRRCIQTESGYDAALYVEMAALGWLGAALPVRYGGSGLPWGSLVYLLEPMGERLVTSPFLASSLAAHLLCQVADETRLAAWLPRIAAGECVASPALSEPRGAYEPEQLQAAALRTAGGYRLSGCKTFVPHAFEAACVLVPARVDGEPGIFLLEADDLRGRLRRETLIDESRRSARLDLEGLELDASRRLPADGARSAAALAATQRLGWLLTAAEMAGGAEGVMQLTLDYLRTRRQFGRLIGSYQALKHPMVDIMIGIEHAKTLLYHAATLFDAPASQQREAEIAVRMAKVQAGEIYRHAADRAIQFHGAIGFTYECHAQLYFRHAQHAYFSFGDNLHHRRHLASLLLDAQVQDLRI
jgi:acyl-CoA dehydrogenase